jgi:PAS domain S-box-containing protein
MSLRTKTLLVMGAVIAALFAGLLAASWLIILRGFEREEERLLRMDVERALGAIERERLGLLSQVKDWGQWDDTYAFMLDRNAEYVHANLSDATWVNLGVSLVAFIGEHGEIAFGRAFGPGEETGEEIPAGVAAVLMAAEVLHGPGNDEGGRAGLIRLGDSIALVAASPVLTSQSTGPSRGTLLFGKFLDEVVISQIAETTQLSLAVYAPDDPALPDDLKAALPSLVSGGPAVVDVLADGRVSGYALLADLDQRPGLAVRVDAPRSIYNAGRSTVLLFLGATALLGAVFVAVVILLLERTVLSRLWGLNASVRKIRGVAGLRARVPGGGSDEISELAAAINSMLESLDREHAERQRAEEALAKSEARFRLMTENALDTVYRFQPGPPPRLEYISPAALSTFGYSPDESCASPELAQKLVGRAYDSLRADAVQDGRALAGAVTVRTERKDGTSIWVEHRMSPVPDQSGVVVAVEGIARDITSRVELLEQVRAGEVQLRALSRKLATAQEDERRRIAGELHDEIGQSLTGLKLMLEAADGRERTGEGQQLDEARSLVTELMGRVRNLALQLRPSLLDDFGLVPALQWHIERFASQSKVRVTFQHSGSERRLPRELETAAYRIVQEALTNTVRHAGAASAKVRIDMSSHLLTLEVTDDGQGFDPAIAAAHPGSIGLASMRERAAALGGRLVVDTAPGKGTSLKAEFPIDDDSSSRN